MRRIDGLLAAMRVTFVLPGRAKRFSGGFKVIYEHATRLARRGHSVRLVHTPFLGERDTLMSRLRARAVHAAGRSGLLSWSPASWLPSEERLELLWIPRLGEAELPDADAIVVSFSQTAERAKHLPATKGRRFYLVQEYEMYMTAPPARQQRMAANFKAGFRTIAISPAVVEMLERSGAPVHAYVPNGIDLDMFRLLRPVEDEDRSTVGFPHRPEGFKGSDVAVLAIELARERIGRELDVWTFGARRPAELPRWVRYVTSPTDAELCRLYNRTTIFVTASDHEGWGLPGCEAMACGAALVSTDSGGVRAYAEHEATALISPVGDVERLAQSIVRLERDRELRIRLATRGRSHVQQFSWSRAVDALERALGAA